MIPRQLRPGYVMIIDMDRARARAHLFGLAQRRSQVLGRHLRPRSVRMSHDTWTALVRDEDPDEAHTVRTWHPRNGGQDRLLEVPVIFDERVPFGELDWRWPE